MAVKATERWLRAAFPAGHSIRVKVLPHLPETEAVGGWDYYGVCDPPVRGRCTIRVSLDQTVEQARETLMHEWAHALTMIGLQSAGQDYHADGFWVAFGRIYRAFYDGGGLGVVEGG